MDTLFSFFGIKTRKKRYRIKNNRTKNNRTKNNRTKNNNNSNYYSNSNINDLDLNNLNNITKINLNLNNRSLNKSKLNKINTNNKIKSSKPNKNYNEVIDLEPKKTKLSREDCIKHSESTTIQNLECFDIIKTYNEGYSELEKELVNVLSFWSTDEPESDRSFPNIVGTGGNKLFKFPGDIDMMQRINFNVNGLKFLDPPIIKNHLIDRFRDIFIKILYNKNYSFIEMKAGFDSRYDLFFEYNNYPNYFRSKDVETLFTPTFIKTILKLPKTKELYNCIKTIFKELKTLRWDIDFFFQAMDTTGKSNVFKDDVYGDEKDLAYAMFNPGYSTRSRVMKTLKDQDIKEFEHLNMYDIFDKNIKEYEIPMLLGNKLYEPKKSRIKIDMYVWDPTETVFKEITNVYIIILRII